MARFGERVMHTCPVCAQTIALGRLVDKEQVVYEYNCLCCGIFLITYGSAVALSKDSSFSEEDKSLLSGYLRNNSNKDNLFLINSSTLKRISDMVEPFRRLSVIDKVNRVLLYLGRSSRFVGMRISVRTDTDYSLFYCKNSEELKEIMGYLRERGMIDGLSTKEETSLTIKGWTQYEELSLKKSESNNVFIAMSFNKELYEVYSTAIAPACKSCGFTALRVDSKEHNEKICDRIIAEIKNSRFVIADFTGQRKGVYFETGFALGLGLKVIWTCAEKDKDSLITSFDTRQYNHILWKNAGDLKSKLVDRIKATIL